MKTIEGHDVKIFTDNIEEVALEQIKTLISIDVFADKKIRIMPYVHAGAGCVIGFTGDLGDKAYRRSVIEKELRNAYGKQYPITQTAETYRCSAVSIF